MIDLHFYECLVEETYFPKIEGQSQADTQSVHKGINTLQSDSSRHLANVQHQNF